MTASGIVFDIKKFSIHDGPGIRTTVFLKGCGLRCWWCHNPESQHPKPELILRPDLCIRCGACVGECPHTAIRVNGSGFVTDRELCQRCGACIDSCYADSREIIGQEMTVEQVMAEVQSDLPFYDESGGGVTFSGGEPMLQDSFLLALLNACKSIDLHTAVDTCGYVATQTLNSIRSYVDLFLYDLKLIDDTRHREVTGAPNTMILENLRLLAAHGHKIILRVPIIPGINDDEDNINGIADLARELPGIEQVDLLPYHKIGSDKYERINMINPMPDTQPPSDARMIEIARVFQNSGLTVKTGG